jgi:hypothetical protein
MPVSIVPKFRRLLSKEQSSVLDTTCIITNQRTVAGQVGGTTASVQTRTSNSNAFSANSNVLQASPSAAQSGYTTTSSGNGKARHNIDTMNTGASSSVTPQRSTIVFLSINNNDSHRLAQIKADNVQDDSFFETLKSEYIAKRGLMRLLFSIWRYSGCDFFEVSNSTLIYEYFSHLIPHFSLKKSKSASMYHVVKACPKPQTMSMNSTQDQPIQCLQLVGMNSNADSIVVIRAVRSICIFGENVEDNVVRTRTLLREYPKDIDKLMKKEI